MFRLAPIRLVAGTFCVSILLPACAVHEDRVVHVMETEITDSVIYEPVIQVHRLVDHEPGIAAPLEPGRESSRFDSEYYVPWSGGQDAAPRSWRSRHPRGVVKLSVGELDFEHREFDNLGNMTLGDETSARLAKFEFEKIRGTTGGGLSFEVISVDEDLHTNTSGITSSDTMAFEFFAHVTIRPTVGRFRAPIRFGPYIHVLEQETAGTSPDEIDYFSFGIRAEFEPEFDLVRTKNVAVSVFGGVHGFAGFSRVDYQSSTTDNDFQTSSYGVGFSTGVRLSLRKFHLQAGYVYSKRTFEESDPENVGGSLQTLNEAEFIHDGVVLSMGVRW